MISCYFQRYTRCDKHTAHAIASTKTRGMEAENRNITWWLIHFLSLLLFPFSESTQTGYPEGCRIGRWELIFGLFNDYSQRNWSNTQRDACTHIYVWGCRAGRRPGPGFQIPLKWWDSPPPSGNLEPANQQAPSKKKGTYQGTAEKPANAQVWKKPGKVWANKITLQTCNQSA